MKKIPLYSLILLLAHILVVAQAEDQNAIEKRKSWVKVYTVQSGDMLSVDNQYGQVKVNLWDRNEIRVDISVTASATTDQRATAYLDAVSIAEKRQGNVISLKTDIDRNQFGSTSWNSWRSQPQQKNSIQIDYVVSMPKNTPLIVKNTFGDTNIPQFQAPLNVLSRNGNFSAEALESAKNALEILYGTAKIGRMGGGKMEVRYSDLDLRQADKLILNYKFGKLNIGAVAHLNADIEYSGDATIGSIGETGNVKLNYSNDFRISRLPASANTVDIQAAYSSMVLPGESSRFDVQVTSGSFNLPANAKVIFTNQPQKTEAFRTTRQYSGKVGTGTGTTIKVISVYGDVRFKD